MFLATIKESPAEVEMLNYFHIENSLNIRKFKKKICFQLHYALTQVFAVFSHWLLFTSDWQCRMRESILVYLESWRATRAYYFMLRC